MGPTDYIHMCSLHQGIGYAVIPESDPLLKISKYKATIRKIDTRKISVLTFFLCPASPLLNKIKVIIIAVCTLHT